MKKVYVVAYKDPQYDNYIQGIHKVFSSKKFADNYLNQVMADDNEMFYKLSEPEEYIVEQ